MAKKQKPKTKATAVAKQKTVKRSTAVAKKVRVSKPRDNDSTYFIKLVLYLVVSTLWIRIESGDSVLPLPIGAFIALMFAFHEKFQIDRKIELALILIGMFISFWLPIGLSISF